MKNTKAILSTLFVMALVIGAVFYLSQKKAIAGLSGSTVDIVGSRVGTTTTAANFFGLGQSGTSSQAVYLKGFADLLVTTFKITGASSTPSGRLTYQFLGSNDSSCATASTTTSMADTVVKSDINWYALGTEGTITATGALATGTVVSLQNLVWECVRVEVNGSSTSALVQTRVKDLQ